METTHWTAGTTSSHPTRLLTPAVLLMLAILLTLTLVCGAALLALAQTASAYSPGDEIWRTSYDGGGSDGDQAAGLVFAPRGYFYVAGLATRTPGGTPDIAVVRYSAAGHRRWVRRYDGPAHEKDVASAAACDGAGNIYVTGYIVRGVYNVDLALIKYSSRGKRLWVRTYDCPKHGDDVGRRIALDGAGNVYVAGCSQTDPADPIGQDLKLLKYDRYGHRKWVRSYDPGVGMYCDANGLVVDKKRGRVYVGGWVDTAANGMQWALARYSTGGSRSWLKFWGAANDDDARALALGRGGSVYQVGRADGGVGLWGDAAIVRWTAAGAIAGGWPDIFNGPADQSEHFYDVAVDRLGKIHVVGDVRGNATSDDAFVRSYDATSAVLWSYTYFHAGAQTLWHVACDPAGNTYAAGYSNEGAANPAYLVMKHANDGSGTSWTRTAKESTILTTGTDTPQDIGWRGGSYKGLYVTGNGDGDTTEWDLFTIRFEP